jgi:DNA-binding response OmpR family regulator
MKNRTVLIIDDDAEMMELLKRIFVRTGARVVGACDGREGLRQFDLHHPDLVVLDVMMPGMDGWEVCRCLRRVSDVPILLLTVKSANRDIAFGLECGADDYVTKPFDVEVLLARARAILRRARQPGEFTAPPAYDDGHLAIDLSQRRVCVRQRPVRLTSTEYQLLTLLYRGAGRVFTYQEILDCVWAGACKESAEYVHVYVYRLRKKLERDPKNPHYFIKEHGVGYRLVLEPGVAAAAS